MTQPDTTRRVKSVPTRLIVFLGQQQQNRNAMTENAHAEQHADDQEHLLVKNPKTEYNDLLIYSKRK